MIKKDIDPENYGETQHMDDGTIVIATKVNRKFYSKLMRLCEKTGMSIYAMLRNCADTFVRYTDSRTNLSPEIQNAMTVFENMEGWGSNFNLANPYAKPEVVEALYFLRDAKSKGCRSVLVELPFIGEWTENINIQEQMERCIELLQPTLYRKLRLIGSDLGSSSVLQTMQMIVNDREAEVDANNIRELFADDDRGDYGQKPHEGGPYRRTMTKDIDSPEFDFKPFDQEP